MLPQAFIDRMKALLGADFDAFFEAFAQKEAQKSLRINSIKCSPDVPECLKELNLSPIPYAPDGYFYHYDRIGNHPLHHAGGIYVQDPAAMCVVNSLPIQKNWRVLDLCAAPGGKSAQLAAALAEGVLVSNEISLPRCKVLAGNLERLGTTNTVVTNATPDYLASVYPHTFDLVVIDAPCSGEGMFRKDPDAILEWSPSAVENCARRQKEILDAALSMVAPGGYLLYSTCTYAPKEDEEIVRYILSTGHFQVLPVAPAVAAATAPGVAPAGEDSATYAMARRFYPHISPGEGQFVCLLQNTEEGAENVSAPQKLPKINPAEEATVRAFLKETLTELPAAPLYRIGNDFYLLPQKALSLPEKFVYNPGVKLGELRGKVFLPHHQFFSAFGKQFRRRLELDPQDPRVSAYLHGDTIPAIDLPNGFCAVTVYGCPLGGGKIVDGVLKNYYPKGLRK